jgi:hypothetical protein
MQKFLHFLEEQTPKNNKKNVAQKLIQNGRCIQDGNQNKICVCSKEGTNRLFYQFFLLYRLSKYLTFM